MRKFKVVKKWPYGPELGTILSNSKFQPDKNRVYDDDGLWNLEIDKIDGFVEEVTYNEFWFIHDYDKVESSNRFDWSENVPKHLRFRTKESAEKFANALKKTKERNSYLSTTSIFELDKAYIQDILEALNDRVK